MRIFETPRKTQLPTRRGLSLPVREIMSSVLCLVLIFLLSLAQATGSLVASQICDDNPPANHGVKITSQASASCMKGRSAEMTVVDTCQDDAVYDIGLPFPIKFLGRSYNGSVFVNSNSYITFGGSAADVHALGPTTPALPTLFIGSLDAKMLYLSAGHDPMGWRVHYEGWPDNSDVLSTCESNVTMAASPTVVWELLFLYDGSMQLCTSVVLNSFGITALSDGFSTSFVHKFALLPSSLYEIFTGLKPCLCDLSSVVENGVSVTSEKSTSCMKGRSPEMFDVRSCGVAGSASIQLPFAFKFLGHIYGGRNNDVFVGDSSFVTFGGSDNTYYTPFSPNSPGLPSILIGARQNVLKTLSVAPDPLGWRVRYEGWSNSGGYGSSSVPPLLSEAFACPSSVRDSVANITWELLFLHDNTLQLCTDSVLGNLDVYFDSNGFNNHICSETDFTRFCSNMMQNGSAISAVSDGSSDSFLRKFDLVPSSLYVISTGVRRCATECDEDPVVNKGVKILSQESDFCLKGRAPDMVDVASCQESKFHSIGLPFPFQFLGRSYGGDEIYVDSGSAVQFGEHGALNIGKTVKNYLYQPAMRTLSVGPDPHGWRVRFEGWSDWQSEFLTIDCTRAPGIIWELLFLHNSSLQLCTGSLLRNADQALYPQPRSSVVAFKNGYFEDISSFTLTVSTLYFISTNIPPCTMHVSLSRPFASSHGVSLTARFPPAFFLGRHDSVTIIVTLRGSGFFSAANTDVLLVTFPDIDAARGTASILNSSYEYPVMVVSLHGISSCNLVSFTLPFISTPLSHQKSSKNISFLISSPNGTKIFQSDMGSLDETMPPISIKEGQPHIQLMNNAIRSTTIVSIVLKPASDSDIILSKSDHSFLVITLAGAGWSFRDNVLEKTTITTVDPLAPVLKVDISGVSSITESSPLQLTIFDLITVNIAQPSYDNIRSAIISHNGSIIAFGANGRLDAVVASSMGVASPKVAFHPPLASATAVRFDVTFTIQSQSQGYIDLPARIIITLSGSGFACKADADVKFMLPFDRASGSARITSFHNVSVLTVDVLSGTFLSGLPVWFQVAPCSNPPIDHPAYSDLAASMIDCNGTIVASSSSGTSVEIVGKKGGILQPSLNLARNVLSVEFTPDVMLPMNARLIISLAGVGLSGMHAFPFVVSRPTFDASGTVTISGGPLGSILSASISTPIAARESILFSVSPVYGGCPSEIRNLSAVLLDEGGSIKSASTSVSFISTTTDHPLNVQQLIEVAVGGVILVPEGVYAGKCNCNSTINESIPLRPVGSALTLKGIAGRTTIDCTGTGMRCLIVRGSSIVIVGLTFKGGSSPIFIPQSMIQAAQAILDSDSANPHFKRHPTSWSASLSNAHLRHKTGNYHSNAAPEYKENHRIIVEAISREERMNSNRFRASFDVGLSSHLRSRFALFQNTSNFNGADSIHRLGISRTILSESISDDLRLNTRRGIRRVDDNADLSKSSENEKGGCLYIDAPNCTLSVFGISLLNCSAVYGGGGFFMVSTFAAENGTASGNVARQGGGMLVSASHNCDIRVFDFVSNTVVTSLMTSDLLSTNSASGAGAWVERLHTMKNCSFLDNAALAASVFVPCLESNTVDCGAHALGSGLFVRQTSSGAELSSILFLRSVLLCSGSNCVSSGTLYIHFAGLSTLITGLRFVECHAETINALGTASACGACMTVFSSSELLKVERIDSFNCSAKSTRSVFGGCVFFAKDLTSAILLNLSVLQFNGASVSFSHGLILGFNSSVTSTIISSVEAQSSQWLCDQSAENNYCEGLIYIKSAGNSSISFVSVSNFTYRGLDNSLLLGGILYMEIHDETVVDSIFVANSSFYVKSPRAVVGGAIIFFLLRNGVLNVTRIVLKHVSVLCIGDQCFVLGMIKVESFGTNSSLVLRNVVGQNISTTCDGLFCSVFGAIVFGELYEMGSPASPKLSAAAGVSFTLVDVIFKNMHMQCIGDYCASYSASLCLSAQTAAVHNVQLQNLSIRSNGTASFAGGSFLFLFHNNPRKSLIISNITSRFASVHALGLSSSAIGGVIAAVYGNLIVENSSFFHTHVICSGENCQSSGGAFAFVSSLGQNEVRLNLPFLTSVSNSDVTASIVECRGTSCIATGGAISASLAYRGPKYLGVVFGGQPPIAHQENSCLPLTLAITNSKFFQNSVVSQSIDSTLTGGGISIVFSRAIIKNSIIVGNFIVSSSSVQHAFIGGGGVFLSGENASALIVSADIRMNSAGHRGKGGGIFVELGTSLTCHYSLIGFNSAVQGGGLLADGSASLTSCSIFNNSATDKGGGLFCVVTSSASSTVKLILSNVSFFDNVVNNTNPSAVGASAYIYGDVRLSISNGILFLMNGNPSYTTMETVVSVSKESSINDVTATCKGGSVLSFVVNDVEKEIITLFGPSVNVQYLTACSPACLFVPQTNLITASSGFTALCVPCPPGTYSLEPSSRADETIASYCRPCPFGAVCKGGDRVSAAKSYWGWRLSNSEVASSFMLLPAGYGCADNCNSISSCGGRREGTLCGACALNHSIAFFSKECVPSAQCTSWKWILIFVICFFYQFLFLLWLFWSTESEMFESLFQLKVNGRQALSQVSLFSKLSRFQIDKILSTIELVYVPARTSIINQGQLGRFMFIVKKGNLDVYIFDVANGETVINRLSASSVIGEMSLISGAKCAASVRASEDCELWKLDHRCLDDVSEEDKNAYVEKKRREYSKSNPSKLIKAVAYDEMQLDAFGVLMWFYQLSGIMLSVASPFSYLDGAAISFSVVSFFFNSKPASEATSDLTSPTNPAANFSAVEDDNFQFCVSSDFTMAQIYMSTFLYYILWALLMALLARHSVWKFLRHRIIQCFFLFANFRHQSDATDPEAFSETLNGQLSEMQKQNMDIQGSVFLKWFIICFSAVSTLLMQSTACVNLDGLGEIGGDWRWIYDGRVACFSNHGILLGEWQFASAAGICLALISPALLWLKMAQLRSIEKLERSQFQELLLQTYLGGFASNAPHWMVIMFYQRLLLMMVSIYLNSSPFFQGYAMMCVCILILAMECSYRPYKSYFTLVLSCTSAAALVAICGLLLRSQSLISAARSPNFDSSKPSTESDGLSKDLLPVVSLLLLLLATPAVLAVILSIIVSVRIKSASKRFHITSSHEPDKMSSGQSVSQSSMTEESGNVKISFLPDHEYLDSQSSAFDTFGVSLSAPFYIERRREGTILPDTDHAQHRGPVWGRFDNLPVSARLPPIRSMPSGRNAPVPVQGVDMSSVVQKTLAHQRQSSPKWQNSSHLSSSGSQFQDINLRTTSSNADFDMSVSNVEAGDWNNLKYQGDAPLSQSFSRPLSRASSLHSDVDGIISNVSTPEVSDSDDDHPASSLHLSALPPNLLVQMRNRTSRSSVEMFV